ncbi:hypothetical protein AURDEDRAFT_117122 [Auricularia subglabra TFB-10046 SS5]|uniref:Uncharacterized protein n=1 Tax=Auricularia subglabra (strain TFB-10046 / SS5) TaxID=717982 RepID=J0D937_AURST|nr:hypothetical protein AURDEDRAFT_117122 [Auricularia subglabra TFB-10046 SS5]
MDVDDVEPKTVVDRFFAVLAEERRGISFEELSGDWTWDKILRRVIALRAKQRGNPASSVAATPRSSRAPSETPSMRVPDFTPQVGFGAARLYPHLAGRVQALKRPDFDAAMGTPQRNGVPAHGTFEFPRKVNAGLTDVPPQLVGLAPRYNTPARPQAAINPPPAFMPPSTPQRTVASVPDAPPSTAKRMMGYLSSWLGVAKPQPQPQRPARVGLPPPPPHRPRNVATPPRKLGERQKAPTVPLHAPPPVIREPTPEVLHPRDSVELQHATPVRHEQERVVPHKDTVDLQHAEPVRHEPVRPPNPREMVELNHVSPPPSTRKMPGPTVGAMRNRTASGGSVKDMVKNFDALAQEKERRRNADLEAATAKMRRTKSLQGLSTLAQAPLARTASVSGIPRPAWR